MYSETERVKIESEMRMLEEKIELNSIMYHELDDPQITDSEYDSMFETLMRLEEKYPELADQKGWRQGIREI